MFSGIHIDRIVNKHAVVVVVVVFVFVVVVNILFVLFGANNLTALYIFHYSSYMSFIVSCYYYVLI